MRKLHLFILVTLDGYFEGNGHDLSWHNTDDDFTKFAYEQLDQTDTLVFGRKTYEVMAEYWPTQLATDQEPETAVRMNRMHKVVFSHQSFEPNWENTEVSTNLIEKIKQLKSQEGKGIAILGSSHLGKQIIEAGLMDELRVMVNPIFIGSGSTLFEGLSTKLKLTNSRPFSNGNVLLTYTCDRTN